MNVALKAALTQISPAARATVLGRLDANLANHEKYHRFDCCYPDAGPLRRALYPKHVDFFAGGAVHQERAFIAANRSGKSTAASYEVTAHLTGRYPSWWAAAALTVRSRHGLQARTARAFGRPSKLRCSVSWARLAPG
jgi:hypothetical protein